MNNQEIVKKLWDLCNVLRDDGITYHQYVTELTYILFLKMAKETGAEKNIPVGYRWENLATYSGITLKNFYVNLLKDLGENGTGIIKEIYQGAATNIDKPANLEKIISQIDSLDWYSAREEGLGNLYEGLLEKNANEKKSGAGQYFTPRPLIDCIVRLMKPQAGELCNDPACGTFGFMIAAAQYVRAHTDDFFDLTEDLQKFEYEEAFTGCELVHDTHRLALMNALLHDLRGKIIFGDTLSSVGQQMQDFDLVLSNPPFGTKKGGERANRDDFTFSTSNKQLNFLQHIYRSLKIGGRAAVVLPDNVLFADGDGESIRVDLMNKCNLHTVLRLPTGIFYAQGVKTNVLFFTRGAGDYNNTKEVWFYDLRTNMPSFGKTAPLTAETFAAFESAFDAPDRRAVVDVRFSVFTRAQIAEKNNSLDLGLIRDDSVVDVEETFNLIDSGEEIISQLQETLDIVEEIVDALKAYGLKKNTANWQLTTLKNVCNLFRGVSYKKNDAHNSKQENDCLILRGGNIKDGFILTDSENVYVDKSFVKPAQFVKKDDVIIVASTASLKVIGRAAISKFDCENVSFGAFLILLRPLQNICSGYFGYFFQTDFYRNLIRTLAAGTNINNIKGEYLTNIEIPVPPLAEQKRIVAQIDFLFAKLDLAQDKLKDVLRRLELHKIYLLKKAFDGTLTAKFRADKNLSIDDWQQKTLGEIIKLFSGQDLKKDDYNSFENGIPYIIGASNFEGENILINRWTEKPTVISKKGDVLITCKGSVGKTAIAKFESAHIARQIMALRMTAEASNFFIYYFLQFKYDELKSCERGLIPGISRKNILSLSINLPPLSEQKEIVRILDSLLTKEKRVKKIAEKTLQQIDALKRNILVKAFRGELCTNDSA